ncbi:MAG TPA: leucine-rich repeat domain-containing protein [Polyangiaceae bacterium]|nr:leucine-rich repeat domain-containing protein [Polyangiaceae bacterium]
MRRSLLWLSALLSLLAACEEKPVPKPDAAPTATAAPLPTPAPAPTPAPTPSPEAAAPKPKRRLEDCPKGAQFEFSDKAIELEVRRKLPKPEGPITVADLRRLRSLNLSQVKLSDLDVCLFTNLRGLKELFLGPGDFDDLSPIATSTQLESLRASINQVKDLKPLEKMSNLDRLDLGRTQVSDLKPLASLKKLSELQLDGTNVEDLTPLANLTELTTLSLKNTKVKDASPLKGLKKLKFLYVGGSPLDADPMSVAPVRANGTKVLAE